MTPTIHERRPQIEAALAYAGGTHLFEDVVAEVESGDLQFWPGANSAIVTELVTFPRKKVCNVFLAGGSMAEIEAMTPLIAEWAKAQGCDTAEIVGRRGWGRAFLIQQGWTNLNLEVLERDLHDGF